MRIDFTDIDRVWAKDAAPESRAPIWGVDSEYGRLTDVMLCAPDHLAPVPCCSVTIDNLRRGFEPCAAATAAQHRALVRALEASGVRCHIAPPAPGLPDLAFARDAALMTPWGLLALNPAAPHRRTEPAHVQAAAADLRVPLLGGIAEGAAEGGDICVLRPGLVVIGCSDVRTNEAGARSVARLFERHGWRAIVYRFDPHFLHLDTQFCMLDANRALASVDVLDDAFLETLTGLGIDLVPVTYKEVQRLGANVVGLGHNRVLSAAGSQRINAALKALGYEVVAVELDQFTCCGGGPHCLTLPLARASV